MIIKQDSKIQKKKFGFKGISALLALVLIGVLVSVVYLLLNRSQLVTLEEDKMELLANGEAVDGTHFVAGAFKTTGVPARTQEKVFEGEYAIKLLAPNQQYGFSYEFKDMKPGEYIVVQVWQQGTDNTDGCLVMTSTDYKAVYEQVCQGVKSENGWKLLRITAKMPENLADSTLKVYCYNSSNSAVYFDQMTFLRSDEPIISWQPEDIQLVIKEGEYKRLEQNREKALEKGILQTTDESWVKGAIYPESQEDQKIDVDLRLKGDWLDHLVGEKWSFRVKTASDKAWNRLKVFSLQHPRTRSYLKEWLLHQWFDLEDVLTTRYEFVNLAVNSKELGLYICEEHFIKQVLEYNLRREGPIVKFTEDGLWESRDQSHRHGTGSMEDEKTNPDIRPFQEGKTFNSETLRQQFELAQNLLYEYRHGLKPLKEVFDIDLLAKYYAIIDISGSHHAVIWHNQRFYYNPIIGRLEPIGYDGYDETGGTWVQHAPFFGGKLERVKEGNELFPNIFSDWDFVERYHYYLHQYSQKSYLDNLLEKLQGPIENRLSYIISVEPEYNYKTNYLYERAARIRMSLDPMASSITTRTLETGKIAVCNRHLAAIKIIGSTSQEGGIVNALETPMVIPVMPNNKLPDYSYVATVPENAKYLVYQVLGLDKTYTVDISKWPVPQAFTPMQALQSNLDTNAQAYHLDTEKQHVIFKTKSVIDEPIIIPEGYQVLFPAGTEIDIRNKAFILSYSAVQFMGDQEQPILIHSSDASANGIIVLKAKKKSLVNYTTFSNLNTLSYQGWNLTGAVTFYESDVDIYRSTFTKNHCEDALNVIRSKFTFQNSAVTYTYADGFDADFCTGIVRQGYFDHTGNDGIDFSTSLTEIVDTKITNAGDKGISIGEQGTATVKNTSVDGAVIGIASKDLSKVTIGSIDLKNCQQGFSAYQKKPEYGGGNIYVTAYTANAVDVLYKIFPGSYLKLVNQEIKGD